ncbi:MAG TPA: RagB/SusD family nutrient uptake outer membrane protein [Cryomorphaceae bacterium]|nr:RagB/SusD family nutrient uptake outer membrane protein [Owenweeksia sp.]HAD95820.1 RagB/SusD family nutrient uptake outer membrane protein [Cryomorphaceae bacterium]HBF21003.1 RagB/SusD family nutrient uptake outer membrane protein [Cryomorphaceae bacterium]|tara:strand:- start:193 stop:1590 length:1398 start_codon:yes stop_codon:yes gene_type:complete
MLPFKMKKISLLNITSSIILFLAVVSCKKDFLDLAPNSEANSENFFEVEADFRSALTGAYARLQSYVTPYFEMVEYRSDNLTLEAPTAGTQDRYNIDHFSETPANEIVLETWGAYYNAIARANLILLKLEDADLNATAAEQFEGEARFIRAFTYFNILRFWGSAPLPLEPLSPEEALAQAQAPPEAILSAIAEDLEKASFLLPPAYGESEIGHATSWASKALLGKVYLWNKNYQKAKEVLSELQGSPHSLLPEIADVFRSDNEWNNEIIFAIRFAREVDGEGHNAWLLTYDTTNTPLTQNLKDAFEPGDKRRAMIGFAKDGFTYMPRKFLAPISVTTNKTGNDYIVLRYADVLLMLAEAENEITPLSPSAFDALNTVRNRAGLASLTTSEVGTQEDFRNAVLQERRVELPFEGHRWFDLLAAGRAETTMNAQGLSIQTYQQLYPIPQSEIEKINKPAVLSQNPGY